MDLSVRERARARTAADRWRMSRDVFFLRRRRRLHFSKNTERKEGHPKMHVNWSETFLPVITGFSSAILENWELTGKWLNTPALKEKVKKLISYGHKGKCA